MKRTICLSLGLLLCGCQTVSNFVEEHPKATAITAALIVGSLAANAGSYSGKLGPEVPSPGNPCEPNPDVCR